MRRTIVLLMLLVPFVLAAQEVAEDELRELGTADIDFINYEGPYDRIDTDEEIRGIGRALAAGIADGRTQYEFSGKYRVIHAVDPNVETGLDADIILPLAGSRLDHIDNVRRILSGFLEERYDYSRGDADLIARFVTIYNAVVRGNMEFFTGRYKPVVTGNLDAATAGLSRRYDEWPGKSRIVIPLSSGAGPGVLGAVEPGELGDQQVIEELRSQEDMGVEQRQDLVDLTERVIEERESQIDTEQTQISQEEQRITQREQEIQAEQEQIDAQRANADAETQAALDQRQAELANEQAQLAEDRQQLEQRQEDLQSDRQNVAELTAQVREERERIASDTRSLLDEREISDEIRGLAGEVQPVYFIQIREVDNTVLGQLVQINPTNGLLVNRSAENSIVSRTYTFLGDALLVIVVDGESGRLAQFDVTTLEEVTRGEDEVFLGSSLSVHGSPAVAYAVVRQEGEYYVGRFDADLMLLERSVIAVNPYTTFAFGGDKLWVQTKDDRIISLSLEDLRISR